MSHVRRGACVLTLVALLLPACGGGGGGGDGTPAETVLGMMVFSRSGSGSGSSVTGVELQLGWYDGDYMMFAATPALTGTEAGMAFETLAGTSPEVDEYFARLTGGVAGTAAVGTWNVPGGGGGMAGKEESLELLNKHPSLGGPDLGGATITRMVVVMPRVHVITGDPHSYSLEGLVTYYGYP